MGARSKQKITKILESQGHIVNPKIVPGPAKGAILIAERQQQMAEVSADIWAQKDAVLQALFDVALGHKIYIEVPGPTGDPFSAVYDRSPDAATLRYLMDRMLGKPREVLDVQIAYPSEVIDALGRVLSRHVDRDMAQRILTDLSEEMYIVEPVHQSSS